MAGKGGGAWKVAYADFVTAMMAFFMVMWITAQGQDVKEAVAQYFNDPFAMPSKFPPGAASILPLKGSDASGRTELTSGASKGRGRGTADSDASAAGKKRQGGATKRKSGLFVLHDGKQATQGTVVSFAEFSADLGPEAKDELKRLAPALLGQPNKIEVRGHSTARPLPPGSPFHDAWQLAYARCLVTMKYLVDLGVKPECIRLSQAGPYEPQTIRVTPDWEKHNSRVEVYVLDETPEELTGTREERDERFEAP